MTSKRFLSVLFLLCSFAFYAQKKATISGRITSGNESVPFATVYVKGGVEGTNSDLKGYYSFEVVPGGINY